MGKTKRQLYAAAFLAEISYGLFILVASLMAVKVIASPFMLGMTGTLHIGTRIIGNYIFGQLSDRIGRKTLMILSCVMNIAAFAILAFANSQAIFLAYFVAGIGNAIFWPVIEAWIGHGTSNENLLRFLGTFGLAFTGGVTLGNLSGGVFTKIGPEISLIFGSLLTVVVGGLIWGASETNPEPAETGHSPANAAGHTLHPKLRQAFLYIGWVANFATWTAIGINRFLFAKLGVKLGIDPSMIGTINATMYVFWFMMFGVMMCWRFWIYKIKPLILFQGLGLAALIVMGLFPGQTTFFITFGLFGVSAAMTYLSSMFYGQNAATDRGHKSGLHEMILGCGMLVGPFCGGLVAQMISLQAPFLFSAIMVGLAMIVETVMFLNVRFKAI